jgi:hypothetical protein
LYVESQPKTLIMKLNYKVLYLLLCFIAFGNATGQSLYHKWVKTEGVSLAYSGGVSIKYTSNGESYVCGSIDNNIFIRKHNVNGAVLWDKILSGGGLDVAYSLTIDNAENIYATGYFENSIDFDPGAGTHTLTSKGRSDYFVLSLDKSGNFRWANSFGSTGDDWGFAIHYEGSGSLYITGYYENTVDFDPGADSANQTSAGLIDIFIQKLDTAGNFVWAKSIGGTSYDYGYAITNDNLGNIYLGGYFFSTIDADPGAGTHLITSGGNRDILTLKLDSMGNFMWAHGLGAGGDDRAQSIHLDKSGNLIVTGYFDGTVDFDPGPSTWQLVTSGVGTFIQKLDTSGKFIWAKSIGNSVWARGAKLDNQDNIFVCGNFYQTIDFDPNTGIHNETALGGSDLFVLKLDGAGAFINVLTAGGTGDDLATAVEVDERNNVYLTGQFSKTVDFDPTTNIENYTSTGKGDYFAIKYSLCSNQSAVNQAVQQCTNFVSARGDVYTNSGTYIDVLTTQGGCDSIITVNFTRLQSTASSITINACRTFTSPSGKYNWTQGGTYIDTIPNTTGCDSIITIALTIDQSDTSVSISGKTLSAAGSMDSYQWINCSDLAPVPNAQSQSFTPTQNGNYAVIVKKGACTDTSACHTITGLGTSTPKTETIQVYPNPSQNNFTISLGELYPEVTISLYTPLGQKITTHTYTNTAAINFDLEVSKGIYYLEINIENSISVVKVTKQ